MQETWVRFLDQEDPQEKEMTTHSSTLTWRISWTEKPGGLHSPWGCKSRTWLTTSTTSGTKARIVFTDTKNFFSPKSFKRGSWGSVKSIVSPLSCCLRLDSSLMLTGDRLFPTNITCLCDSLFGPVSLCFLLWIFCSMVALAVNLYRLFNFKKYANFWEGRSHVKCSYHDKKEREKDRVSSFSGFRCCPEADLK